MNTEKIEKILGLIIKVGLSVTAVIKVAQFALSTIKEFNPDTDKKPE
jgi:hypothetical protein